MFSSGTLLSILLVVALVAAVYLLLGASERQRAKQKGKSGKKAMQRAIRRPQARWKRHLPIVLLIGAVACLVVALAQFRTTQTGKPGTVILTMDVSESMNQQDVSPSRLQAAVAAARTFLDQLPANYPVGLVTFADTATVVTPPVQDHQDVSAALNDLARGKGTVIGDGLETALGQIQHDWQANGQRPSAIVLLSDGRDTGSATPPEQAAKDAAAVGVPVYTVVLGTSDPNAKGAANAVLLRALAETTGATSFTAGSSTELNQIYAELGTQLSTQLKISNSAALFVIAAVLLAIAAGITVLLGQRSEF
ncbi:MAG: vWA domain-containing protein [Planctomycetaceae bacterium]